MADNRLLLQIRASALAALRPALHVLLVALAWLPVQTLINLVFDSEANVEWRLPLILGGVFAAIWYVALFVSTLTDLRKQERIDVARTPSFSAQAFYSGLYGVTAVLSLLLIGGLHREGDPLWIQLLPLVFVAIAFYGWPRTIHCNETSISQRDLWGRNKRLPYTSIEAISVSHDGTTTVLGAETTIEHTQCHFGSQAFRDLVSRRSGKPVY